MCALGGGLNWREPAFPPRCPFLSPLLLAICRKHLFSSVHGLYSLFFSSLGGRQRPSLHRSARLSPLSLPPAPSPVVLQAGCLAGTLFSGSLPASPVPPSRGQGDAQCHLKCKLKCLPPPARARLEKRGAATIAIHTTGLSRRGWPAAAAGPPQHRGHARYK